ncbi:MAG: response regulator [Candidatus Omnitrophica bacterium]|nr:response regulator [Candidatus Omnitrophota bacterium]
MDAKKRRILLVDDEPSILKMVSKRLEVAGFEVMVAMDGEEGLEKAKSLGPDVVILDLMLPKLNGYEVCAALKADPRHSKLPIILLSARVQDQDEKSGLGCGADAYMRKPFNSQDLVEQINTLSRRAAA